MTQTAPPVPPSGDAALGARAAAALATQAGDVDDVPADLAARAVARAFAAPAPADSLSLVVRLGLRFFAASAVTAAVALVVTVAQPSTSTPTAAGTSADAWSSWHSAAYESGSR
jgi:hypothetical protein